MKTLNTMAIFSILLFSSLASYAIPVNINTADAETISNSLNGIGSVKATAIIEYRKTHGDFSSAKSLSLVKGIGEKIILRNKDDIQL